MFEDITEESTPDTLTCGGVVPAAAKTVSLVLGAGGARGLAHIGVIQWLVENGFQIRSIAGSSMGALIGGIYATGELDAYTEWVLALKRMQVLTLLDPALGRAGLFRGERLMGVLRNLVGDCVIEDLPLSYTAVAADLESGKEIWLREGNLFDAIRASIATPLLFTPHEYGGRRLLDGALVNPIPIAPTLNDTTHLTIAVNLCGRADPAAPAALDATLAGTSTLERIRARFRKSSGSGITIPSRGAVQVALAAMDSMQTAIARLKLAANTPDVVVDIPRNACGFHEFWRARELIALGRERAAQAFSRHDAHAPSHHHLVAETITLGNHHHPAHHHVPANHAAAPVQSANGKALDRAKEAAKEAIQDTTKATAALLRRASISPT